MNFVVYSAGYNSFPIKLREITLCKENSIEKVVKKCKNQSSVGLEFMKEFIVREQWAFFEYTKRSTKS